MDVPIWRFENQNTCFHHFILAVTGGDECYRSRQYAVHQEAICGRRRPPKDVSTSLDTLIMCKVGLSAFIVNMPG